ncbi:MAG TPA: hypothetical protein VGL75_15025 [Acidothermaceae bacterium]
MEHVVFFPAPDGTPAFRRLATVDDAARFVEHLRNVENVSEASVHTLTEVPLSFKTWYRVEIPNSEEGADTAQLGRSDQAEAEVAAPTTIAEMIESYASDDDSVNLDNLQPSGADGSSTGILVPEREFLPPVQIAFASSQAEEPVFFGQPVAEPDRPAAQVLEPAFGSRRERGTGYFVR